MNEIGTLNHVRSQFTARMVELTPLAVKHLTLRLYNWTDYMKASTHLHIASTYT